MSKTTNIFITGATGYIGGSVLHRFITSPGFDTLKITALVRSQEKADKLNFLGVGTVLGSLADLSLLEKAASEADVVINLADADDLDAVKALLKGVEQRHKETGTTPSFIHTSGAGVLCDMAGGMYAYDTVYNDEDPDQIETLAPTQVHRIIDLAIIDADKKGFVKTYLILPSMVYGIASGKLVDLGIQNQYSVQVPVLVSLSLDRGQGGMVGEGKNIWPNVHVDDLADLYLVLYNAVVARSDIGHGREGIYFGENGEHTFYDLGVAISKALVDLGKGKAIEPTTLSKEELDRYFLGTDAFGANSRCKGNRSRAIGWRPKKTTADLMDSIKPEAIALIEDSRYKATLSRFLAFFQSSMANYMKLLKENIGTI